MGRASVQVGVGVGGTVEYGKRPKVVTLFTGGGLKAYGAKMAGCDLVGAVENRPVATSYLLRRRLRGFISSVDVFRCSGTVTIPAEAG